MSLPLVIVNPASAVGATEENWLKSASDLRTYKEIGEFVMRKVAELGEADRKLMQDPKS